MVKPSLYRRSNSSYYNSKNKDSKDNKSSSELPSNVQGSLYNNNITQPSIWSTLRESFIIGTGVSVANQMINRSFDAIIGPRSITIKNPKDNDCINTLTKYENCIKSNNLECSNILDEYNKCKNSN